MKLVLTRSYETGKETVGKMELFSDDNIFELKLFTIELPWRENKVGYSRIMAGNYIVERRWSIKYGWHLHVLGVSGRSYILIHSGNYFTQTRGCILVGTALGRLGNDDEIDLLNSRVALKALLRLVGSRQISFQVINPKIV